MKVFRLVFCASAFFLFLSHTSTMSMEGVSEEVLSGGAALIQTRYGERKSEFNKDPLTVNVEHTAKINTVLKNKPSEKHAGSTEKKLVLKAVMATALIHGDSQSFEILQYDRQNLNLFMHYEILRMTQ